MEITRDQQTQTEAKTRLVEQINTCLRSGNYSRAVDLVQGAATGFPDDPELAELEKVAHDGVQRKGEADGLITQSQELFAQRKSADAIQLLRKAYDLDKTNSLARSILANALVEHANSIVETEWWGAESLAKEALALNPVHPTAKTIYSLIIERKKASSVEEWVLRASKLQSSGDLFAALAWVAEGLAVHPDDPKLLQIQHAIQREQAARRRQTRRSDLQDLRRMEQEIDRAADAATKQALAERIQALAARYWTDGEILSLANGLLQRLGLVEGTAPASPNSNAAPVIFHVPLPKPVRTTTTQVQASPVAPKEVPPKPIPRTKTPAPAAVLSSKVAPAVVPTQKVAPLPPEPQLPAPPLPVPVTQASAAADKTPPRSSPAKKSQPSKSNSTAIVLVCIAVALVSCAAIVFFARKHPAAPVSKTPAVAPTTPAQESRAPVAPAPTASAAEVPANPETTPETSLPASSDTAAEQAQPETPSPDSGHTFGTLVIVAGQDGARVFLNGKVQRQLTQSGQVRLLNLEPKDYVVQVTKTGFQDPAPQKIRIREGEQTRLAFNLQPQPHLASLMIQGGAPGTTVLVDQNLVGTIQPDGTLSVSTVNPGDHVVELRKDRFKPRQFKKHFVAGAAITIAAADAALEAAPAELKITFSPPDANVAIAKGEFLKIVTSGVPLNVPAGTYTLTARTAERFTRSSTLEVVAGQSKTLDLSLAPNGMAKWEDPGAWKHEGDSYTRRGGDFVLYGVVPASGTFVFSGMPKGHLMQWVLDYTSPSNYMLFQIDEKNFYRSVIRNGQKTDEIIVPHKGDKKSFRTVQVRVSPTEIVHLTKDGDSWTVLDRWTQPGANLSVGKFGFYIPGNEQLSLSSFSHYADLNLR